MTHFGIICTAANGHLNLMCVGIKLQRRGHRLTLFHPDIESKVKTAGLEFQAIGSAFFSPGKLAQYKQLEENSKILSTVDNT